MRKRILGLAAMFCLGAFNSARGGMVITEWMYNGTGTGSIGEFAEFTNTGPSPVDMTGWSFDDNTRVPGSQSLSAFGTVAVGESVLFTDNTEAAFRTDWNLGALVKIIGGNANNLGREDEVNLFNGTTLVDRLTYGDQTFLAGSIRTNGVSGNTTPANLGTNNVAGWSLSTAGDARGSYTSVAGEIGNPGTAVVPEPAGMALLAVASLAVRRRRRA